MKGKADDKNLKLPDGILKFRSVDIKFGPNKIREIKMFADTSSCLKIYDFFYDAQIYIVGKKSV